MPRRKVNRSEPEGHPEALEDEKTEPASTGHMDPRSMSRAMPWFSEKMTSSDQAHWQILGYDHERWDAWNSKHSYARHREESLGEMGGCRDFRWGIVVLKRLLLS